MVRILFIVNALLTFPFGVLALVAPATVFAQFGLQLDAAGELIARGYSATLIAYGVALFLQRQTTDRGAIHAFLLSMLAFNTIEAVIQGAAGVQGLTSAVIFGNVAIHAIVAVMSGLALLKQRALA